MTLREKIQFEIGDNCEHSSYCKRKECQTQNGVICHVDKKTVEKCETISDNYAIEFAEWFADNHTEEYYYEENYTRYMLQIFKKEKGL